jgi:hypothetical protein
MVLHGLSNAGQLPRCPVPRKQQQKQPETKTVDIATQCENHRHNPKNWRLKAFKYPTLPFFPGPGKVLAFSLANH